MKKLLILLAFLGVLSLNAQTPTRHNGGVVLGDLIGTSGDPPCTKAGQIYWNDTLKKFRQCDGTTWSDLSATGADPTLQEVTDAGGTTDDNMSIENNTARFFQVSNLANTIGTTMHSTGLMSVYDLGATIELDATNDWIIFKDIGTGFDLRLAFPSITGSTKTATFQNITGTVALTSDISGTNSGTNTGDQTIQLTGDVTGTGTGTFAATLDKVAITGKVLATAVGTDHVIISDVSDGGNLKKVLVSDLTGSGATQLDELSDVVSAANTDKFAIMANGTTGYVGRALVEADISNLQSYLTSEVDGSITNEGDLTVLAGTSTTSLISSNTSGSTDVTLTAGTNIGISEAGNVITLTSTDQFVGTVTNVTGGVGVSSSGGAAPSIALTVDELAEKTGALVGTDRLVGTTTTTNWSETISGIPLSIFNDDLGHTENATHTGEVTGSTTLTVDPTAISNKTLVTAVTGDMLLIEDLTDGNLKRVNASDFLSGAGDVTAAANLGDNLLIRGDGAGKGVQNSGIIITDGDDIQIHVPGNDANPWLEIGATGTNNFRFQTFYNSGTGVLDRVDFTTFTSSSTGDDGRFNFLVDEVQRLLINDTGITITGGIQLVGGSGDFLLDDGSLDTATYLDGINATAAEVNILDLSATALTTGWGYFADGASTASWRQLLGSEISNTENWAADQTSIVGITGIKSQFDTAVTDGNFLYVGDVTSNVTTNLSEGTTTNTTVDVNSSDGTNATLLAASTTRAGVMTKAKFDEIVVNNAKVTANATNVNSAGAVMESDYNANTILAATTDDTPTALTVAASRFVGRKATGDIDDMTPAEAITVLGITPDDIPDRIYEDATTITTQDLDYSLYEIYNFTVTGAVTFTESNLPTSGTNGKVILINITGDFALTYPANWSTNISGVYDGTVNNTIVVWYIKSATYKVQISQPD